MRILHFADIHIGIETYGRTDPQTGLSTRLLDTLSAFDEVVEHALSEHVDLVLFCGDAYRSREPSQTHQREFARRLLRLSRANIPVFLLVGNHDLPHALGRASALEIFGVLEVPQTTIGDRLAIYRIETLAGPVQIVALPWPRRSVLFNKEEVRGLSLDQVTGLVQERLADGLEREFGRLEPSIPAVLAGHAMLSSATASGERNMMLGQDHVLMPSSVINPALDYVALGHVHRHQVLHQLPLTTYSGSLQRTDFGEADEEKGFCIVDIDPSKPQGRRLTDFRFVKVNARPFVTVEVSIQQSDLDPTSTILEAISRNRIQDAIVRLLITAPEELAPLIRDGEIRAALERAHHVASIRKETSGRNRSRLGMADSRTMSTMEALDKYLELRGIAAERKALLKRYARELLSTIETRMD